MTRWTWMERRREQRQRERAERQAHIDALADLEPRLRARRCSTLLIRERSHVQLQVDTGPDRASLSERIVVVCIRVGDVLTYKSMGGLDFGPVDEPDAAAEQVAERVAFRAGDE